MLLRKVCVLSPFSFHWMSCLHVLGVQQLHISRTCTIHNALIIPGRHVAWKGNVYTLYICTCAFYTHHFFTCKSEPWKIKGFSVACAEAGNICISPAQATWRLGIAGESTRSCWHLGMCRRGIWKGLTFQVQPIDSTCVPGWVAIKRP